MKRILTAATLAALIATPAFAAPRYRMQSAQAVGAPVVIEDGHYRGADPDAAIRLDLRRDNQSYRG